MRTTGHRDSPRDHQAPAVNGRVPADHSRVRAWHPELPGVSEAYHATLNHSYPIHTHDEWTLMVVDAGAVAYDLDRGHHDATTSTLTVLPPGIPHDGHPAVPGTSFRKRVLYLDADWLPESSRGRAAHAPTLRATDTITAAKRIHAALEHPEDLMVAEHWLLTVRDAVLAHLGDAPPVLHDAPLARRLRDLLDDRLTAPVTIAQAAAQLGAHPSHLVRSFSQSYGIAPHQYVISRRIDRARHLLVDGHRPAEVAALAGFHDQAHLTRHFRKLLGITPAVFAA